MLPENRRLSGLHKLSSLSHDGLHYDNFNVSSFTQRLTRREEHGLLLYR